MSGVDETNHGVLPERCDYCDGVWADPPQCCPAAVMDYEEYHAELQADLQTHWHCGDDDFDLDDA